MSIPFYRAFEDRYRGSRESIHERQQVYVPFLEPLKQLYPECRAVDLGCGRGEWLEILTQTGFKPLGVDLDTGMLDACNALGLPVEKGDALEMLKSLPDESLTVVTGFHIAEHIPFEDLKVLVVETLRVLKPAGLLILETPNSENLVVGTQTFYLDPTHERPIPHLLLSFLTEYSGFSRSKLLRLQESTALAKGGGVGLMDVLHGVSLDYAIIAQKRASLEQMEKFDAIFAQDYGLSLETLARRYDAQLARWMEQSDAVSVELREQLDHVKQRSQQLEIFVHEAGRHGENNHNHAEMKTQLREASLRADLAESRFQNAELRLKEAFATIERCQAQVEHLEQDALMRESVRQARAQDGVQELKNRLNESLKNEQHWRSQAHANEAQIAALVNSASWRITQPLRTLKSLFNWVIRLPVRLAKRVIRSLQVRLIRFVLSRPRLRSRISNKIKSYPRLFGRMRQLALLHGDLQPDIGTLTTAIEPSEDNSSTPTASPRVVRIYCELKLAFERKENR
ncbi:methyltransferase domain-containing protein [Pseudomonas chlororaphis]